VTHGAAADSSVELATSVGSITLANPIVTAAGTSGHGAELAAYFDLGSIGAVVVKSLSAFAWRGNASPRLWPVPGGMLNSVGLQGPGVEAWAADELPRLRATGASVIVSLWGRRVEEFGEAAALLRRGIGGDGAGPVRAIEVNVSCPNLDDRSRMFAHSPAATAAVVRACLEASTGLPLVAKLSPNTPDLLAVANAALEAGAESLTLVNTLLGLAIDLETRRPALGGVGGGLSGPALHAVALRAVYECRRAFPAAGIFGVGGVSDAEGVIRMLMAGADAVQIGTATLADPRAPARVLGGLPAALRRLGARSVREVVGAAV
jgi:dihydroorotate dehydrogenase (NAD+) catalytic subunit